MTSNFKSGFIAIIGRPNVGKSTLLNRIIGHKIAVISPIAQTTRDVIKGVKTTKDYQMIFTDSPGFHSPKDSMGKFLNENAVKSFYQADVILMIVPVNEYIGKNDLLIFKKISKINCPVILCINKIDLVGQQDLQNKISAWSEFGFFKNIIPISAQNNLNIDNLITQICDKLPSGPKYYDDETLSDQSEYFYIQELIREQILSSAKEEVPHQIAVLCDSIEEDETIIKISAQIITTRDSQKGIIIGKGGSNIKRIGSNTRLELENYFQKKVHLDINVKTIKNWRQNTNLMTKLGYKTT